jgi:Fe2+ or Zn2+ uptake regulation protein
VRVSGDRDRVLEAIFRRRRPNAARSVLERARQGHLVSGSINNVYKELRTAAQ